MFPDKKNLLGLGDITNTINLEFINLHCALDEQVQGRIIVDMHNQNLAIAIFLIHKFQRVRL